MCSCVFMSVFVYGCRDVGAVAGDDFLYYYYYCYCF